MPRLVNDKEEFLKLVDDDHFIGKRVYTAKTQKQLNEYANDLRYGNGILIVMLVVLNLDKVCTVHQIILKGIN